MIYGFSEADSGFVPIFVYAIFGSSRQLAVGPVALVSLLVSNVLAGIADTSDALYTELAILLALMVGILECIMGLLRYLFLSLWNSPEYKIGPDMHGQVTVEMIF